MAPGVGEQDQQIRPRCYVVNWGTTKRQLISYGFKPDSDDPWTVIGIPKWEGPDPCATDVTNILKSGRQVATMGLAPSDDPLTKRIKRRHSDKLQHAAWSCLDALPGVLKEGTSCSKQHMDGNG